MLYHVTYAFQSYSALYSCLNVKDLLARNRCDIWSLSDSNGIQTHNHLFSKRTLNHLAQLAKWLSYVVSTYLYVAFGCILSCHVRFSKRICTLVTWMSRKLFARNRRDIWSLNDNNGIRNHNHLVGKLWSVFKE